MEYSEKTQKDPGRPDAIEEITNRFFIHKISSFLVKFFAKTGVHPNWVSFMGFLSGWGASYLYLSSPEAPEMALYGFLAMIGWHILDGTDGKLARYTGKTSALGKVIDGMADYAVFIVVYIALIIMMWENWGWTAILLGVGAGISHAIQSAKYEAEREFYNSFILGKKVSAARDTHSEGGRWSWLGSLQSTYEAAQASNRAGKLTLLLRQKSEEQQLQIKAKFAPKIESNIAGWSVMCANYRTILIFMSALVGMPELFFLIEIFLLNVLLVILSRKTFTLYNHIEEDVVVR